MRLHTHLAEDPDEDKFAAEKFGGRTIDHFESVGWMTDRSWVAHCIYPNEAEVARLGRAGVGVAHCPSSNMMIGGGGIAPVAAMRAAGSPVGLGCDGSSSTDSASLWMEARNAMLLGRLRGGPASTGARDALEIATRGGAGCLGRAGEIGELTVGAVGDLVVWPVAGDIAHAGALSDPVEAWLRCGPSAAKHTVVAGRVIVRDGALVDDRVDEMLAWHRRVRGEVPEPLVERGGHREERFVHPTAREQAEPDRLPLDRAAVHGDLGGASEARGTGECQRSRPHRLLRRAFEVDAIGGTLRRWQREHDAARSAPSDEVSDLDTPPFCGRDLVSSDTRRVREALRYARTERRSRAR